MRYRMHGNQFAWPVNDAAVTDCPRRLDAGDVPASRFREIEKLALDEILELLSRRPRTMAQDNRRQYDALAELNRKNAEFWSKQ
jgi:hypothetical protein